MRLIFEKLHKSSNKYLNRLKNNVSELSEKQLKEMKMLHSFLSERKDFDVDDELIHYTNKLFLKKLKKTGVKVSDEDTYKVPKRSVIKHSNWRSIQYDLLKEGRKLYFSINIKVNVLDDYTDSRELIQLEHTNILKKVKFHKELNNISFIPKIVEIVVVYKKGNVDGIKIISDYIKGMTLRDYLKKKKLTNSKRIELKKNIMKKLDVIEQKGFRYWDEFWDMASDVIIDNNNKVFITGINYHSEEEIENDKKYLESILDKIPYSKSYLSYEDLILDSLIKKKKLVFKS